MLFVFGYRSENLSALIHNSEAFPNFDGCRVAVHFKEIIDNDDGTFRVVPNSEFVVGREAKRNNQSFYTIDNRRAEFKEVSQLLKKHHIDLDHNRFMILQEEVESIAMMKPMGQNANECGVLEYLEDIIGTTRYKEPWAKIIAKVGQLTEEQTVNHNRCKLAKRDMNDLKQPMEEGMEFLKEENKLIETRNIQYQKNW